MSRQLITRSPDLKALEDDGYSIEVIDGHLVICEVPYVNADRKIMYGKLVSKLDLAGDRTVMPSSHVAMFAGEHPCDEKGCELVEIKCQGSDMTIHDGLVINHWFSNKPQKGTYRDYYQKMTTYINILVHYARKVDSSVTAKNRSVVKRGDRDSMFKYIDTAPSRAGITSLSRKLEVSRVAIVGLGGTGSYILDLIAKTPVREIHLFDGDDFLQHNAFRSPGAASMEELKEKPNKAHYFKSRYDPMREGVFANDFYIEESNICVLEGMDFVFLSVDNAKAKAPIVRKLKCLGTPFIDVGMGVTLDGERLLGVLRTTAYTAKKSNHIDKRINLSVDAEDDLYSQNIQTADLNALNATLAVVKWKKLCGFYVDLKGEHSSYYIVDGNIVINEDIS